MYIQYRGLEIIEISGRPDKDNEEILNGLYDNPINSCNKTTRLRKIFSDWQDGDILVISNYPLQHPKFQENTLVEMTREEICASGDLTTLNDGEVFENGVIKTIPRIDGIKVEWQYPNWVETATLEEQLEFYKQEILNANRELLVYERAGFTNEELQIKLSELIKKHNEISLDIASEENRLF